MPNEARYSWEFEMFLRTEMKVVGDLGKSYLADQLYEEALC